MHSHLQHKGQKTMLQASKEFQRCLLIKEREEWHKLQCKLLNVLYRFIRQTEEDCSSNNLVMRNSYQLLNKPFTTKNNTPEMI